MDCDREVVQVACAVDVQIMEDLGIPGWFMVVVVVVVVVDHAHRDRLERTL